MTAGPYDLGGQARERHLGERPATQAQISTLSRQIADLERRLDALEKGRKTLKPEPRGRIR